MINLKILKIVHICVAATYFEIWDKPSLEFLRSTVQKSHQQINLLTDFYLHKIL